MFLGTGRLVWPIPLSKANTPLLARQARSTELFIGVQARLNKNHRDATIQGIPSFPGDLVHGRTRCHVRTAPPVRRPPKGTTAIIPSF